MKRQDKSAKAVEVLIYQMFNVAALPEARWSSILNEAQPPNPPNGIESLLLLVCLKVRFRRLHLAEYSHDCCESAVAQKFESDRLREYKYSLLP